jgi:integrase
MNIKNNNTIPPASLDNVGEWLAEVGMTVDLEQLTVVHYVLSRLLGEGSGDRANFHNLATPLAALGTRSLRRNGVEEAAPFPHLAPTAWPFPVTAKGWPAGATALNRLGMTAADLNLLWRRAVVDDDLHALLPVGVVCAFFPPPLWRMVARVIAWGPAETSYRLRRFLMAEATRELAPTRARRSGGTVSKHTIKNRYALMRRLMSVLVDLRSAGWCLPGDNKPCERLEGWQTLPLPIDLDQLDAQDANTDRSAPPLRVVRLALADILGELDQRKRTEAGRRGMLKVYRDTLLLSLLAVLGARVGDIHGIRPCDYDPHRRGRDGQRGPAIRLRIKKLRGAERWKPIPTEVAQLLEGWLAYTGLDSAEHRERVIWIAEWASQRAVGQPGPESPDGTLKQAVAGDGRGGRTAMLAKDEDPSSGHSAHTLRHLAEQLAKRFGHGWLNEHPEHLGRISDGVFADALLDHAWGASDVNGYSDLERGREYFAGLAAAGIWELVAGGRGARTAPDWDRILRAQQRLDEAEAVAVDYGQRVDALRAERGRLMHADADPDLDALDLKPLVLRMYRDQQAIARINATVDQLVDEHMAARDQVRRAHDDLNHARNQRVAVADEVTDAEYEALLERPPSIEHAVDTDDGAREPIRAWLTPVEAAWAWGYSKPQMRAWFRGEGRPPWDATEAILEISPRKRRLLTDRLDRTRIAPSVMKRINVLLCQEPSSTRSETTHAVT